jgi:hypothetical protein
VGPLVARIRECARKAETLALFPLKRVNRADDGRAVDRNGRHGEAARCRSAIVIRHCHGYRVAACLLVRVRSGTEPASASLSLCRPCPSVLAPRPCRRVRTIAPVVVANVSIVPAPA